MIKNVVCLLVLATSSSAFATSQKSSLMCLNKFQLNQPQYSVSVVVGADSKGTLTVSRNGVVLLEDAVGAFADDTISTAEGANSTLVVDYSDDSAGRLRFCEANTLVDIGFDYKECTETSVEWSTKAPSAQYPVLPCEKP